MIYRAGASGPTTRNSTTHSAQLGGERRGGILGEGALGINN